MAQPDPVGFAVEHGPDAEALTADGGRSSACDTADRLTLPLPRPLIERLLS